MSVGDVPGGWGKMEILAEPHRRSTRTAQQPRFQPVNPSELCFPAVPRASNERPLERALLTSSRAALTLGRDGGCALAASMMG